MCAKDPRTMIRKKIENQARGRPLTPALSPEYREEGERALADLMRYS